MGTPQMICPAMGRGCALIVTLRLHAIASVRDEIGVLIAHRRIRTRGHTLRFECTLPRSRHVVHLVGHPRRSSER